MQKWEYCSVLSTIWSEAAGIFARVEIGGTRYTPEEYLNILGADGWELVSVTSDEVGNSREFFLKRPKS